MDDLNKEDWETLDFEIKQEYANTQNQPSSLLETTSSIVGGLFDIPTSEADYEPSEAEFQRQQRLKKKKRRFRL